MDASVRRTAPRIGLLETRGRIAMFLGRSSEAAEHFKRPRVTGAVRQVQ